MTAIRTSEPFISTPKDSPAYWLLDILWVVHATGERTRGSYSLVEQWMPQGGGPPPHVHPYADESFWVMEGEMTVEVGGKTLVLGPGSLGHVPRNTVHSFKVTSEAVCHILNYYTPAGFEQCIIGSARPAERRELPPVGLDPLDSPQVARFFNNYWVAPADLPWALQRVSRKDWPRERGLAPAVPGRCLSPLPGAAPPENGDRHRPGTTGASPHFQAPLAFSTRSQTFDRAD